VQDSVAEIQDVADAARFLAASRADPAHPIFGAEEDIRVHVPCSAMDSDHVAHGAKSVRQSR